MLKYSSWGYFVMEARTNAQAAVMQLARTGK